MPFDRGSLDQINISIVQVEALTPTVQQYINDHIEEIAVDHMVPEIRAMAMAMNIPEGFIEGVRTAPGSTKNSVKIINTWGTRSKPLAKWFNYGTRDHGPVTASALHWVDKKTGEDIFAKWVRGIPRTQAMELGMQLGKKRFIDSLLLRSRENVTKELSLNGR